MRSTLERWLVRDAFQMALAARKPTARLLCHSDRCSQYASGDYQEALQKAGAVCRMSPKGNCYDNAPTESFFASLKRELVYRISFATREHAWGRYWCGLQSRTTANGVIPRSVTSVPKRSRDNINSNRSNYRG